jgi:branched-chain amino acid aminotransferase
VFDHGLLYGDGIFEGIRAYNRRVFKLDAHLDRLARSAHAIQLALPRSPADLAGIVVETCARNEIVDGYIRLVVTRGPGDLGIDPRKCRSGATLIVIAQPAIALYDGAAEGIRAITATHRRIAPDALSPSIKSLNYLNNVLARLEANARGADEALLLDANGYVAEASADNVFIVRGGRAVTPWTSTNLPGVTRETVMELCAEMAIPVDERPFTLFETWTADEVFVCGTGAEIVPVVEVDGRAIGAGSPGPITLRLVEAYAALVRSTGTPIPVPARTGHQG